MYCGQVGICRDWKHRADTGVISRLGTHRVSLGHVYVLYVYIPKYARRLLLLEDPIGPIGHWSTDSGTGKYPDVYSE